MFIIGFYMLMNSIIVSELLNTFPVISKKHFILFSKPELSYILYFNYLKSTNIQQNWSYET